MKSRAFGSHELQGAQDARSSEIGAHSPPSAGIKRNYQNTSGLIWNLKIRLLIKSLLDFHEYLLSDLPSSAKRGDHMGHGSSLMSSSLSNWLTFINNFNSSD